MTTTRLLAERDSLSLITDYLTTEAMPMTAELAKVRGWITETLEERGDDGLLAIALGLCPSCWATTCDCGADHA